MKSIEKSEWYEWAKDKEERRSRGNMFSWVSEVKDDCVVISKKDFWNFLILK